MGLISRLFMIFINACEGSLIRNVTYMKESFFGYALSTVSLYLHSMQQNHIFYSTTGFRIPG